MRLRGPIEIAERCRFSLDELRYEYPTELAPRGPDAAGVSDAAHLGRARPSAIPAACRTKCAQLIEHELELIGELRYEAYFLTVWDLVRFARSRNILCQGRGSAANSAVCFCLGVTSVDPATIDVLFERFVSRERNEAPDIDVDFEHERREEVLQYLYEKYGRERAGLAATVITYRSRSAVRDVGKALGLSLDRVDALAKHVEGYTHEPKLVGRCREVGIDPASDLGRRLIYCVNEIIGFPRHLSQHVGGMVMTQGPLCELVPIENAAMEDRTVIEWDKDDLDELGILKVDCLCLGMLTAIHKCFDLVQRASRPRVDAGHDPAGRPGGVRHDLPGRHDRRVPDREPGADDDAAAAAAADVLRPGDRGGDRAARADPGEHGASVPAAAAGRGSGDVSQRRDSRGARKRRWACRFFRSRRCGWPWWRPVHAGRGRSAAPGDGRLAPAGRHRAVSQEAARRACRPTACREEFAERVYQQIRGFRRVRLSRVARGQLRAVGVCLGVAQALLPGRVRRGADQQPADGLLCAGAVGARCARARRARCGRWM